MSSVSCLRCFQNLSEIISGWLALEEERFWARPTSTKVGTELTKVGTENKWEAGNKQSYPPLVGVKGKVCKIVQELDAGSQLVHVIMMVII